MRRMKMSAMVDSQFILIMEEEVKVEQAGRDETPFILRHCFALEN
jgi:hypothetical protein